MQWLYLLLNLASISVPLAYSFEKKMHFIQHWRQVFLSTVFVAIPFLIWDIIFTKQGIWGFTPSYNTGITILGLPLEEYLFFICIPYACIFMYYAFAHFFPRTALPKRAVAIISVLLLCLAGLMVATHLGKAYTVVNFLFFSVVLLMGVRWGATILQRFYLVFCLILLPFFLINGILTGSFIEAQVVWYNNDENMSFRIGTIPFEDIFYAFSMIFLNIFLLEKFLLKKGTT
ncbi:MAG: lycopene cyclase domain-containing protein [Flavobacteriaceae bacterium]